jgi:hypothetical protein
MKRWQLVSIFVAFGIPLEAFSFFLAIAFIGVKDFGSHWVLAAVFQLGQWPKQVSPNFGNSSEWGDIYLLPPIARWMLIGWILNNFLKKEHRSIDSTAIGLG